MSGNIVAAVVVSDLAFSDGDSSRQEEAEDIYANGGDAAIEWPRLREETRCLTVKKNC